MCPWFCGHVHKSVDITVPNTNFICKIAVMHYYGILFSIRAQKMQMDDACTYTCIFEHISSYSIAHISTTHQSTNMCRRYIYMTAVNVHRSNLRKTGVLKLLQDKKQLLIKTQTPVIVLPTYSLTNLQKFLNTAFFLKEYIKMVFYRMWGVSLKTS